MTASFPSEWLSVTGAEFVVDPKSDIVDGPFGSNLKASEYTESGIPIARIQNVKRFSFIDKNIRFVSEEKAKELQRHSFIRGDLLITKLGNPLGLTCEVPESFEYGIIVADLVRLRPNLDICSKPYLIYLLNSELVIKQIELHVKGTTRPRINLSVIRNLSLPLAPLAEQKAIAKKLGILLAQVEATKARLEQIPKILKTFRQSVLSVAVTGELIGKTSNKELKLENCVEILNGARLPVSADKRKSIQGDIPYYGATGVLDSLNSFTHEGQFLLVGEDGANLLSKSKDLAFIVEGKIWVNNHAHVLKEKEGFDLDFLKISINSLDLTPWVTGSAQPKLTKRALSELPIPNFVLEEQIEIVRRAEDLFAFADSIEEKANAALERVNNLTQSILAKAFRGELTAEWRAANPELISGENSAEALLEKIKAEREVLKSQPKHTVVKRHVGKRMSKEIITVVEALKEAGKPLSGQQLLAASGYPSDSSTEQLEQFFLDIRDSLVIKKSITKLERGDDEQDWFTVADTTAHE